MTREVLEQYVYLKKEEKDIQKRIENTRMKIKELDMGGTVLDTVSGTRRDGTFGSIRIEGFPAREYYKQVDALKRYLRVLEKTESKASQLLAEAEEYINSIADAKMRMIIRYRVLDELSWYEVADRIGGKATSDSCRKYFERFFEKC